MATNKLEKVLIIHQQWSSTSSQWARPGKLKSDIILQIKHGQGKKKIKLIKIDNYIIKKSFKLKQISH